MKLTPCKYHIKQIFANLDVIFSELHFTRSESYFKVHRFLNTYNVV